MKYNININQFAVINSGLDLDIIDLAIFDFVKDLVSSERCIKFATPEGEYMVISDKLIASQLPILGINTKWGILKHINKLINADILIKHPHCEVYGRSLYRLGKNYDRLVFASIPSTNVDSTPQQTLIPPSTNVDSTPQQTLIPPSTNVDDIINISYNKTKENNITYNNSFTPLTPRGEFGQSENCPPPPPSTDENFKNFSVSEATGTIPVNTTATAVSEKEKSSAKKEKEIQPILGDLFGGVVQVAAETAKPAKNAKKSEVAEVLRGFWNSICVPKGFPAVKELNQARIDKASAMVKEMQKDGTSAQDLFEKIVNAVALWENRSNGGEDGSWFNFDWLIYGKRKKEFDPNWKLIMSGRYDLSFRKGLVDKRSQSAQQMQRAGEFLGALEQQHPELSPLEMLELIQQH